MGTPPLNSNVPKFDTADFAGTTGTDRCQFCKQPIGGMYYRVNGAMACGSCAEKAQRELPKSQHAAFVRAALFGAGAALLGFILYAAVGIITGWMIGYVSLAVGYLVGKAMMKGSRGLGGRRYQLTAVLLTYVAVSTAAIPIAIAQYAKQPKTGRAQTQPASGSQQQPAENRGASQAAESGQPSAPSGAGVQPVRIGALLGYLILIGLASPFLELADPLHGLIGLVILFVGIQIAWKITAGTTKVEVAGPFQSGVTAAGAS